MLDFDIVRESKSPSSKGCVSKVDTYHGSEADAATYAHSFAVNHAVSCFQNTGKNRVTRSDKGGWFETAGGTVVRYAAERS